jgi:hypothetical protein
MRIEGEEEEELRTAWSRASIPRKAAAERAALRKAAAGRDALHMVAAGIGTCHSDVFFLPLIQYHSSREIVVESVWMVQGASIHNDSVRL